MYTHASSERPVGWERVMRVEVWSDVMCPWCYIGKRRLEWALTRFERREETEVIWRSFELRPQHPGPPRETLGEIMQRRKEIGPEGVTKLFWWIQKLGAAEGLELNLATARPVRSFDAHRLIHLAAGSGLADEMKERLLQAYLIDNEDVADHDVLVAAARDVGLHADEARTALAGGAFSDAVRIDEARAAELDVAAIPTFIVDGEERVSGAATGEELLALLRRASRLPAT